MKLFGIDEQPIEIEQEQLIVMNPIHMKSANRKSIAVSSIKYIVLMIPAETALSKGNRSKEV